MAGDFAPKRGRELSGGKYNVAVGKVWLQGYPIDES
jgi:hypothetical protein